MAEMAHSGAIDGEILGVFCHMTGATGETGETPQPIYRTRAHREADYPLLHS